MKCSNTENLLNKHNNLMYEFLETNSMYVVLLIVLIIWVGIFGYLKSMDKQIKNLETKE